jgi:molybdopterin/thiamine biosynthesis adenylyltransferase
MNDEQLRYARQINLPAIGEAGQQRLAQSHALIVGAGGLGTPAALYLASSGVGELTIVDFDKVDPTNLPRQILYRDTDTGEAKARIAAEQLRIINPDVNVTAIDQKADTETLATWLDQADVILDCTDNFASRWQINELCHTQGKPLVSGAAIRLEGQLAVFRHDDSGPCFRCLYEEADENLNDCAGQGILAPVAGTVGTMMATETIKVLLNIDSDLAGSLWTYDAASGRSQLIRIPRRADCPVCGSG